MSLIIETNGQLKIKEKVKVKKPKSYKVLMYNDDFTPMDFVVELLMEIFDKSKKEAVAIMYMVHNSEYAAVGIYTYDIASTKASEAMNKARKAGYPLRVKVVEA